MSTMPEDAPPVKAEVLVDGAVHAVTVRVAGHFEPLDGRVHWSGRMTAPSELVALLRTGRRDVTLRCTGGEPVPARLAELDPWGGIRFTGTGTPPVPLE